MPQKKVKRKSFITPPGIASYAYVYRPQDPMESDGGPPKYSITLLIDKKKAAGLKELKAACLEAAEKKFGQGYQALLKRGKITMPFRDGDEEKEGTPDEELFSGKIFLTAKTSTKPGVVEIVEGEPVRLEDDSEFYSGCIAQISCFPFAYDRKGNKGVTLILNNVRKVKDGTRLSGRPSAEEDFADEIEDNDDDDDLF